MGRFNNPRQTRIPRPFGAVPLPVPGDYNIALLRNLPLTSKAVLYESWNELGTHGDGIGSLTRSFVICSRRRTRFHQRVLLVYISIEVANGKGPTANGSGVTTSSATRFRPRAYEARTTRRRSGQCAIWPTPWQSSWSPPVPMEFCARRSRSRKSCRTVVKNVKLISDLNSDLADLSSSQAQSKDATRGEGA